MIITKNESNNIKLNSINIFLKNNFDYYTETHNIHIASLEVKPLFSHIDANGENIHEAIVYWINELFIKKDLDNIFSTNFLDLTNNYVILYGDYLTLNSKISNQIKKLYNKKIFYLYNTDKLYFNYTNNFFDIEKNIHKINNIYWRPYTYNLYYNQIIETIIYIIFDIFAYLYPTYFNFNKSTYFYDLINNDISLEKTNHSYYNISNVYDKHIIIKTYLYQTLLFYIHKQKINYLSNDLKQHILTIPRKDIFIIFDNFTNKGLPKTILKSKLLIDNYSPLYYNNIEYIENNFIIIIIFAVIIILFIIIIYIFYYFTFIKKYRKSDDFFTTVFDVLD